MTGFRGSCRRGFSLVALSAAGLWGGALPVQAQETWLARLTRFLGDTSVRRSVTGALVQPVVTGVPLDVGNVVLTGANGFAALLFRDGREVKLNQETSLELTGVAPDRMRVLRGSLLARIPHRRRTIIEGPAAVAFTRGTELLVAVAEDGTTTLTVLEGEVEFTNDRGRVVVQEAQQSVARLGEAPSRPQVVDASGLIAWEANVETLAIPIEMPLTPPGRDLEKLAEEHQQATDLDPGNAVAFLALADTLQDLGRFREAVGAYDSALALQPVLPAVIAHRAQLDLREGRLEAAATAYAQLAAKYPDSAEGPLGLGVTQLATGDVEPAIRRLERAAELAPRDARPQTFLGVARLRRGDASGAEAMLRAAVRLDEGFYPAHAYLSFALTLRGEVGAAREAARQAVGLAPHSSLSQAALANALFYAGEAAAAEKAVNAALETNPLSAPAQLTRAKILAATDRVSEGARVARLAVVLDPKDPVGHTTLGVMLLAENDLTGAGRAFQTALALDPGQATAQTGLASVYARQGAFSQALAQQKAAVALDSSSAAARNNLGGLYLAQGKIKAAIAEFRQAAVLQPAWGLPHANLAQAYLELNRYAEALAEGEEAVRLHEESAVLRTTLARVFLHIQRPDRALAELRIAEALDPEHPPALFQLSRLYLEQRRDQDALRSVLRATSVQPGAMVEDRLYARTEARFAGGDPGALQFNGRSDGRALDGALSFFTSGEQFRTDHDRDENSDQRQTFGLGLVGYERTSRQQWLLFTSRFDQDGGRPGQEIAGRAEDPNYRSESDVTEFQLLHRRATGLRSHLTLKAGTRTRELNDRNPDSLAPEPFTAVDRKPFLTLDTRIEQLLAEARWDRRLSRRDRLTLGVAWRDESQHLRGLVGVLDPTRTPPFEREISDVRNDVTRTTFYGEWFRRAGARLDLKIGGVLGRTSGTDALALPKLAAVYRPAGRSYLVLLVDPTFEPDAAELSPVEAWAEPFGIEQVGLAPTGRTLSYELHYQQPASRLSLFSLSLFTRSARELLLDTEDPRLAPAPTRKRVGRARLSGVNAAIEHSLGPTLTGRIFARYQRTEDRDTGETLPYFALWEGGTRLDYLDREGWRSFLRIRYVSSRHTGRQRPPSGAPDVRDRRKVPGYTLLDVRLSRQLDLRRNLFVEIDNVLDRGFETFLGYPGAGRTVFGGVEYRF